MLPDIPWTSLSSALRRDPRLPSNMPYSPAVQADVAQINYIQTSFYGNSLPLPDVIDQLDNANVPPQIHMVPFMQRITVRDTPTRILSYNPNRMAFMVINTNTLTVDNIAISFDYPVGKSFASSGNLGIPIAPGGLYQESNGTVTINDIWVWAITITAPITAINILAYEGTLALSGKFGGKYK